MLKNENFKTDKKHKIFMNKKLRITKNTKFQHLKKCKLLRFYQHLFFIYPHP